MSLTTWFFLFPQIKFSKFPLSLMTIFSKKTEHGKFPVFFFRGYSIIQKENGNQELELRMGIWGEMVDAHITHVSVLLAEAEEGHGRSAPPESWSVFSG